MGKTGSGKTHLMEYWASQLIAASEPFLFLDFHGDATQHLLQLAAGHPEAHDRFVLIDPTDRTTSPGLNPLERPVGDENVVFGRASELAAILHRRWQVDAFGARTEELLRNTLYVLGATSHTLVEAPLLLTSHEFRQALVARITNDDIRDYWQRRYEPLSEAMKSAFREALLNKITGFLTEPSCRHLLGQVTSTIDLLRAMDDGKWVVVNLAKGELRDHAHTLGNLIFARLQFEILGRVARPERARRLFTIFADEMQNLAENDLTTLFAEGRKFGVSLVTGHQFWDQVPKEVRGALLSAGTHVFFRVSSNDAAVLAPELSVSDRQRFHRDLTTLPRGRAFVRIGSDPAIEVGVPGLARPQVGHRRLAELRDASLRRNARPRVAIETEIQTRRTTVLPTTLDLPPLHDDHPDGQHSW